MSALHDRLRRFGQGHLVAHLQTLAADERDALAARLGAIDWAELATPSGHADHAAIEQAEVIALTDRAGLADSCEAAGAKAYAEGRVAALVVAGGQGTRLGFSGPKGCYPIDPAGGRTIFHLLAEGVADVSTRTGHPMPWLVMTSPHTDAPTRSFFAAQADFGLAAGQVRFFSQGTVPSVDEDGRALLAGPAALLENPDGHGGCFEALVGSGELQRLRDEGIDWLVYLQVDNVLGQAHDPFLVGLAELRRADAITKVLAKAHPDERVGHLVRQSGHDRIVEYTELSAQDVRRKGPDGAYIYRWGNTAMHCWRIGYLAALADRDHHLPLHRSRKPLKAWKNGEISEVTGFKSERFIFDLLAAADVSLGLEVARADEFSPVKNAEGTDSPATARAMLGLADA